MVKRYDQGWHSDMVMDPTGEYVEFEDYEKLEAENEKLLAKIACLEDVIQRNPDDRVRALADADGALVRQEIGMAETEQSLAQAVALLVQWRNRDELFPDEVEVFDGETIAFLDKQQGAE